MFVVRWGRAMLGEPRLAGFALLSSLFWLVPVAQPVAMAQSASQVEILERLQRLEENQDKLNQELKARDARIEELEAELSRVKEGRKEPSGPGAAPAAPVAAEAPPPVAPTPETAAEVAAVPAETPGPEKKQRYFGTYVPGRGFGLVQTESGDVFFSAFTYVRYLNQMGLDHSYINGQGEKTRIDRRDDVNMNKVTLYFKGWLMDPRFRYLFYVWTNNTSQGLSAQVVVGGNLTYAFDEALVVGAGIAALPGVRSNEGSWPYFLTVDHRTLADEFFRGSYTMGFFASGKPLEGVQYSMMLGNNLSQLGVDAGQLDGDFTTVSAALAWMPTTGEFGTRGAYGDYDEHEKVATRLAAHFTFSPEDRQSQPGTEDPDNTQIRLSNGTVIFNPDALAPDTRVKRVNYYMTSFDGGVKFRGFALEGEYYLRWLDHFTTDGHIPDDNFFDHGFQVLGSMMVLPKTVQVYTLGSYIFGEFGDPWELTAGVNWWVFKRRELRINLEYIYDRKSPIGYAAIPQAVGGTGSIFHANLELYF